MTPTLQSRKSVPTVDELDSAEEEVRHEYPVDDGRPQEGEEREDDTDVLAPPPQVEATHIRELNACVGAICSETYQIQFKKPIKQ